MADMKVEMIMDVKRTERGWPGHFIYAEECVFRRNTLLEYGESKIVVSTVGSYIGANGKIDTINCNRWYETKSFEALFENGYWDADVYKPLVLDDVECGLCAESYDELIKKYPKPDNAANDMHENYVKKVIEMMKGD